MREGWKAGRRVGLAEGGAKAGGVGLGAGHQGSPLPLPARLSKLQAVAISPQAHSPIAAHFQAGGGSPGCAPGQQQHDQEGPQGRVGQARAIERHAQSRRHCRGDEESEGSVERRVLAAEGGRRASSGGGWRQAGTHGRQALRQATHAASLGQRASDLLLFNPNNGTHATSSRSAVGCQSSCSCCMRSSTRL